MAGVGSDASPFPDFADVRAALRCYSVERESRPNHEGKHVRIRDLEGAPSKWVLLTLILEANAEGWRLSDCSDTGDELLFVPFESE